MQFPDLELVLQAVVKCAPHAWYSIALELDFTNGQIQEMSSGVATAEGKLQKIVHVKADAVGEQEAAYLLLSACEKIPNPVIGRGFNNCNILESPTLQAYA